MTAIRFAEQPSASAREARSAEADERVFSQESLAE